MKHDKDGFERITSRAGLEKHSGLPHSISNELLSVPQSTIDTFGLTNPYF
jgi:hypothetical protein